MHATTQRFSGHRRIFNSDHPLQALPGTAESEISPMSPGRLEHKRNFNYAHPVQALAGTAEIQILPMSPTAAHGQRSSNQRTFLTAVFYCTPPGLPVRSSEAPLRSCGNPPGTDGTPAALPTGVSFVCASPTCGLTSAALPGGASLMSDPARAA